MKDIFYTDLHIHSKYSRATSREMELEMIEEWCLKKGIDVIATGDFTHPLWLVSLKKKLVKAENGLYLLQSSILKERQKKSGVSSTRISLSPKDGRRVYFIPSTEIALIYSQKARTYRIHLVLIAPCFEVVEELNQALDKIGNLDADGRPILGLEAKELAHLLFSISDEFILIPAHIWTPWFSLFGDRSGFDSIEECFGEYTSKIFALETGLSSDPPMNWRWSALDRFQLVSNSDAHSPDKIAREANALQGEISYENIYNALKIGRNFQYTIEFFPQEGKYHYSGHMSCGVRLSPEEARREKDVCPRCKKPITIGVAERVDKLADRRLGVKKDNLIPYKSVIPLVTILSDLLRVGEKTKTVSVMYEKLVEAFQNELNVLLNVPREELEEVVSPQIAQGILAARQGQVEIEPGFDGEYGRVRVRLDKKGGKKQGVLFS